MLQCVKCRAMGTVDDSTEEEWAEAHHAPSEPYRWEDDSRVTMRHEEFGEPYIVKSRPKPSCECAARIEGFEHPVYERVPIEISHHSRILSKEEKGHLEALAGCVTKAGLCSTLFPLAVQCFEQDTGMETPVGVKIVADQVARFDRHGGHFSPWVVELILNAYIERSDRNRLSQQK